MIPKTLSATAVDVAENCLARFKVEMLDRSKGITNRAASNGSTVHAALEDYVTAVYVTKSATSDPKLLLKYYKAHAITNFGSTDFEEYPDGVDMLEKWFARTTPEFDSGKRTVMSVEVKKTFPLKTSVGIIPFTYIFDRLDKKDDGSIEVVDYKTNRWSFSPEDLRHKVQPRAYAVAASVQLKEEGVSWDRIRVQFDMLRHTPIGTSFNRDDNIKTYSYLQEVAERIIATSAATAPATLNTMCGFCSVKSTCPVLLKNVNTGGMFSLTPAQIVDRRTELDFQRKAVVAALAEIDNYVIDQAQKTDETEWTTDSNRMQIAVSKRRTVDPQMVEKIIGDDLFSRYGGKTITLAQVDKLMKDASVSEEMKRDLKSMIHTKVGEPYVKSESRGMTDE